MTERERLLAKQIEFMSGRRSDQPIRTLDSEENAILDLPTTTSYVTVYSGHLLGVYRIETSFVNWNHNQETPALKDGVNGSFELKVIMAS